MKRVFTILKTREVTRFERITADSVEEAIQKLEKKIKDEGFDVPCNWRYDGSDGTYNMSNNPNGD